MKRPGRVVAILAVFALGMLSTNVVEAFTTLSNKKGTVVVKQQDAGDGLSTTSDSFVPMPEMSVTVNVPKDGLILARFSSLGRCFDGVDAGTDCTGGVRLILDGITEIPPSSSRTFVNDPGGTGALFRASFERASGPLSKGTHTVSAEFTAFSAGDNFQLFTSQLTVQSFK